MPIGDLRVNLVADTQQFSRDLQQANERLGEVASAFNELGERARTTNAVLGVSAQTSAQLSKSLQQEAQARRLVSDEASLLTRGLSSGLNLLGQWSGRLIESTRSHFGLARAQHENAQATREVAQAVAAFEGPMARAAESTQALTERLERQAKVQGELLMQSSKRAEVGSWGWTGSSTRIEKPGEEWFMTATGEREAARQVASKGTVSPSSEGEPVTGLNLNKIISIVSISAVWTGWLLLVKNLATAAGEAAEKNERLRASFTATTGSIEDATISMRASFELSQKLGLETGNLTEQYIKLAGATKLSTLTGSDVSKLFESLAIASQRAGLEQASMNRVFDTVNGLFGKATVSLADLLSLERALPGSLEASARAMKTSTDGLVEMANQGKLLTEVYLPRFAAQIRRDIGDASVDAVNLGVSGAQKLSNEWKQVLIALGGSGRGMLDELKGTLADFLRYIREGSQVAQEAITRDANEVLKKVEETARKVKIYSAGGVVTTGTAIGATGAETKELARIQQTRERLARQGTSEASLWDKVQFYATGGLWKSDFSWDEKRHKLDQQERQILDTIAARNRGNAEVGGRAGEWSQEREDAARAQVVSNKQLQEVLAASTAKIAELNKAASITPEVFGSQGTSLDKATQHIEFYTRRISELRSKLDDFTKAELQRPDEAGAVPGDILAQKQVLQRQLSEAESTKKAIEKAVQDADAAARKAAAEREAAARRAKQAALEVEQNRWSEDMQRQQGASQAFSQLEALAKKYRETKAERDADTASILAHRVEGFKEYETLALLYKTQVEWGESLQALMQKESAAAEKRFDISQKAKADLDHWEELLGMANGQKITAAQRTYVRAESELLGKGLDPDRVKNVLGQLTPQFVLAQKYAGKFADYMEGVFEQVATGAKISFGTIATEFGRLMFQMVIEASGVKEALNTLFRNLIKGDGSTGSGLGGWLGKLGPAIAGLFGGGISGSNMTGSISVGTGTSIGTGANADWAAGGGLAEGGALLPNRYYTVGERGSETVFMGQDGHGYVTPNRAQGNGGGNIYVTINTPDAQSFVRSSGEWQQRMVAAYRKAQRNA